MTFDTYPSHNRISDWRGKLSSDPDVDCSELSGDADSITRSEDLPWAPPFLQDLQIDVSLEDDSTSVFASDPLYPLDRFGADTAFDSGAFTLSEVFDD